MKRIAVTASVFKTLTMLAAIIGIAIQETGDRILHDRHVTAIGHTIMYCVLVALSIWLFAEARATQGRSRILYIILALTPAVALYHFPLQMPHADAADHDAVENSERSGISVSVGLDGKATVSVPIDATNPAALLPIFSFACTDDPTRTRQWNLTPVTAVLNAHQKVLNADFADMTNAKTAEFLQKLCAAAHARGAVFGEILANLSTVDPDGTEQPVPSCPLLASCAINAVAIERAAAR